MSSLTSKLGELATGKTLSPTLWSPNISYNKGDIVVYFKQESK